VREEYPRCNYGCPFWNHGYPFWDHGYPHPKKSVLQILGLGISTHQAQSDSKLSSSQPMEASPGHCRLVHLRWTWKQEAAFGAVHRVLHKSLRRVLRQNVEPQGEILAHEVVHDVVTRWEKRRNVVWDQLDHLIFQHFFSPSGSSKAYRRAPWTVFLLFRRRQRLPSSDEWDRYGCRSWSIQMANQASAPRIWRIGYTLRSPQGSLSQAVPLNQGQFTLWNAQERILFVSLDRILLLRHEEIHVVAFFVLGISRRGRNGHKLGNRQQPQHLP